MENKYYTAKDISKITGLSKTTVYTKIECFGIKPDLRETGINGRNLNYYLFETICKFFSLSITIPIPKKERKPYFEFASIIVESKINANGTN
jgi:hypothetical protein